MGTVAFIPHRDYDFNDSHSSAIEISKYEIPPVRARRYDSFREGGWLIFFYFFLFFLSENSIRSILNYIWEFWNCNWLLTSLNIWFGSPRSNSNTYVEISNRYPHRISPRFPNIFRYSVFDLHPSVRILALECRNSTGSRNGIRVTTSISIARSR